jgi:hypothetical protein
MQPAIGTLTVSHAQVGTVEATCTLTADAALSKLGGPMSWPAYGHLGCNRFPLITLVKLRSDNWSYHNIGRFGQSDAALWQ